MLYVSITLFIAAFVLSLCALAYDGDFIGFVLGWVALACLVLFGVTLLVQLLFPNEFKRGIKRERKWRESMVRRGLEDE